MITLNVRAYRLTLIAAIIIGFLLVLAPVAHAQSLFSQNKPEQAQAVRDDALRASAAATMERDATIAKRDAALAAGNAAVAEQLTKAIDRWQKAIDASNAMAAIASVGAQPSGNPAADTAAEDAGWMTLGGLLPAPFNVIAMVGIPIIVREVCGWQLRREAKTKLAAEKKKADENEAAAKSIVNMVDQIRIAKPEVAAAMKDLVSRTETDFTTALTPRASEIIEAERLT